MRRMRAEMEGKFVGPMAITDFLQTFLPCNGLPPMTWTNENALAFRTVAEHKFEVAMYKLLVHKAKNLPCRNSPVLADNLSRLE